MVAAEVSLTFVAARLRRILQDGPEISQPSVRLSGRCVIVGFVVDGAEPLTPALMRALVEIRRAADTTGLPAASRLRLAGVDVLERSPRHCQEWSWEQLRQRAVDFCALREHHLQRVDVGRHRRPVERRAVHLGIAAERGVVELALERLVRIGAYR